MFRHESVLKHMLKMITEKSDASESSGSQWMASNQYGRFFIVFDGRNK